MRGNYTPSAVGMNQQTIHMEGISEEALAEIEGVRRPPGVPPNFFLFSFFLPHNTLLRPCSEAMC